MKNITASTFAFRIKLQKLLRDFFRFLAHAILNGVPFRTAETRQFRRPIPRSDELGNLVRLIDRNEKFVVFGVPDFQIFTRHSIDSSFVEPQKLPDSVIAVNHKISGLESG